MVIKAAASCSNAERSPSSFAELEELVPIICHLFLSALSTAAFCAIEAVQLVHVKTPTCLPAGMDELANDVSHLPQKGRHSFLPAALRDPHAPACRASNVH